VLVELGFPCEILNRNVLLMVLKLVLFEKKLKCMGGFFEKKSKI
jgi:hypothetical protein